jgi:hypothetical protein
MQVLLYSPLIRFRYLTSTGWDHYTFGDGGSWILSIAVWYQKHLSIHKQKRLGYLEHFLSIDDHMQDIQSSNVVHDIIDPNLFPRYFPDNSRAAILNRIAERIKVLETDFVWESNRTRLSTFLWWILIILYPALLIIRIQWV